MALKCVDDGTDVCAHDKVDWYCCVTARDHARYAIMVDGWMNEWVPLNGTTQHTTQHDDITVGVAVVAVAVAVVITAGVPMVK
jgi:hypothetical protein